MRNVLVPTKNVQRYSAAAKALEARLNDDEIQGIGLICGRPGLGKTMFVDSYYARTRGVGNVRIVKVRAQRIWTEASMLRYLLAAVDLAPLVYRKDAMFDQLKRALKRDPAVIIVDEIQEIAGSGALVALLKDVHDICRSSILMVGEERAMGLLGRHESFYNRINRSALVQVTGHSAADVEEIIRARCEYEVDPEVCDEIYRTEGKSVRSVLDEIRGIEQVCLTSRLARFTMTEYRAMKGTGVRAVPKAPARLADVRAMEA